MNACRTLTDPNLQMLGPPGSGKTMLARRLGTILLPLALKEVIEITAVWSVTGLVQHLARRRMAANAGRVATQGH